jgi:hypothetical protein
MGSTASACGNLTRRQSGTPHDGRHVTRYDQRAQR